MKQIDKACYVKHLKHDFLKEGIAAAAIVVLFLIAYGFCVYGDAIDAWWNGGINIVSGWITNLPGLPPGIATVIAWGVLIVSCILVDLFVFYTAIEQPKEGVFGLVMANFFFTMVAVCIFLFICNMIAPSTAEIYAIYIWAGNVVIAIIGVPFARAYGLCKEEIVKP